MFELALLMGLAFPVLHATVLLLLVLVLWRVFRVLGRFL